jgi:uncharacterized protein (TIGR00369 family)
MVDTQNYFHRMLRGESQRPPVLTLLGGRTDVVDVAAGTLSATYDARSDFRNPAGTVQGGMLSAMLDDMTASLVDATLTAGQGVATLSLNVSFLRPAQIGTLQGEARILRRGRDVCHVMGTLLQDGKEVATAVAVCKVI